MSHPGSLLYKHHFKWASKKIGACGGALGEQTQCLGFLAIHYLQNACAWQR